MNQLIVFPDKVMGMKEMPLSEQHSLTPVKRSPSQQPFVPLMSIINHDYSDLCCILALRTF